MEKLLEDAGIKLSSVASEITGVSGRAMLEAMITGERDPDVLANLARRRLRSKIPALTEALTGRFTAHHAFLTRVHPVRLRLRPPSLGLAGAAGCAQAGVMAETLTVNDLLDGHMGLDLECMDRIYLNGYVPSLQVGGQLVSFLTQHLGCPIPSPAIMEKIGTRFRRSVKEFADAEHIPVVLFKKGEWKLEVMRRHITAQAKTGRSGVAAIGVAQEFQNVFAANQRDAPNGIPWFSFTKADRRVTCFYFYLWDADFGPAFIKVCAYFPYPIKVWLNGHDWAKRQATHAGTGFTELSNGFATCADPAGLQAICDRLGPGAIKVFFERWMSILPLPLDQADRAAGYWWELSMRRRGLAHHRLRRTSSRTSAAQTPSS